MNLHDGWVNVWAKRIRKRYSRISYNLNFNLSHRRYRPLLHTAKSTYIPNATVNIRKKKWTSPGAQTDTSKRTKPNGADESVTMSSFVSNDLASLNDPSVRNALLEIVAQGVAALQREITEVRAVNEAHSGEIVSLKSDLAPVPLSIFRSNSKFDENSERSSFEYTWPITTIFCTRHDSDTVVTCAKYRCDRPRKLYTRVFWIFIEFRIRSKYA